MRTFTEEEVEKMLYNESEKIKTNFDRIKAMSVEEFARFAVTEPALAWDNYPEDHEDMLDWLNKEVG